MVELPLEPRKVWALTKRDMYNWSTYKSQAITTMLTAVIGVVAWGFTTTWVSKSVPEYNTDYVSFVIVGILITNIVLPLGAGVQKQLNPWTLETILMTGLKTPTFVLGTTLWTYLLSVVLFIPQLLIGVYIFGAHLVINPISLVISILIASLIVFCLAMIGTGIRIFTKVTDPITWALGVASSVLSGLTFPVSHLDSYLPGLSTISWLLPQTWIYHIIRLSTLEGASVLDPQVGVAFLITLGYAIVLVPIAAYIYRWGMGRAKKDGTLGWL